MSDRLAERVALITGGARGIGAAVAEAFVREGAYVVLTDVRDEEGRIVAQRLGARARYVRLDVREEAQWESVMSDVLSREGRLDVLVNNAGITGLEPSEAESASPHDPEHASLADWRAVHATNLDGVFLGCKHALRTMRRQGSGSIINMGSRSGVVGVAGAAAYASSKAAIRNHTKSVALYAAERGWKIRCNVIQPAAILTPMWEPMLGSGPGRPVRMQEVTRDTPMGRFGAPEEVAALAVHLASEESGYTTGAEFTIDGGMLAGSMLRSRGGAAARGEAV